LVYHARDGRAYLVGGSTRRDSGHHYFNDQWYWSENRWTLLDTLPFRRSSHRVVYNARRNSIVLFGGGADRAFATDAALWEWRGRGWQRVGASPAGGRAEPGLCYDAARQRIVAFGGWDSANQYSDVLWEWTGETGEAVIVPQAHGPSGRAGHAFVYDPQRQRCLLFGGRGHAGFLDDTWEWDGAEWRRLDVRGPSPRWFFGTATDPANRRIVLFGGVGPAGDLGDTWAWDGQRWERLAGDGPMPRGMAKLAFDGGGVLLFGGRSQEAGGFRDRNDTWRLQGGTWHHLR
ncbi:MAG: Kelch repeat-containing protein, partial [Gemmatimonadales bacterium]